MKMKMILSGLASITLLYLISGCHSGNSPVQEGRGGAETVAESRTQVHKDPVAAYQEKTDEPLNNWYFSVRLFETPRTFGYLMKMQFEEVRGEDTIYFPNLGAQPKPEIRKGKDKYSCIVGFMDNENKFREYKLVYVKNGKVLGTQTLHHYAMVQVPQSR
jgi:hypothetical protein